MLPSSSQPDDPFSDTTRIVPTIRQWWKKHRTHTSFTRTTGSLAAIAWEFLRDSTPSRQRQRYGDIDYDWERRVDTTAATVSWKTRLLGLLHSPYQPTEPGLFREMMEDLKIDFRNFTFIDLGSGKGRTLLMAADYPFRRIIGVELLPELHEVARANIAKLSDRRALVETQCGDARSFHFPADPTVLYLFNPLPAEGLAQVIANLEVSLRETPRPAFVIYHNPLHEQVLAGSPLLRKISGTHQFVIYASTRSPES